MQTVTVPRTMTMNRSIKCEIISNDALCCSDVDSPIGTSDHCSVLFELSVSLPKCVDAVSLLPLRPDFNRADWGGFNIYLSTFNWNTVFANCLTVDHFWDTFCDVTANGMSYYVPSISVTRHLSARKYPKSICRLMSAK